MKKLMILGSLILLFSCTPKAQNEFTYWVNSYKVQCDGVGSTNCLLIQKAETVDPGKWNNFYSSIEGFEYQPGFIYKLKVKEEKIENPPADASSIKFTLVKILEKKADLKLNINDIWLATSIDGVEIERGSDSSTVATIEIHLADKRISGSDGCNRFTGAIKLFDDGILELGPLAGTQMMCENMAVADRFNQAILKVKKYNLGDKNLTLTDESGHELMLLKKVD